MYRQYLFSEQKQREAKVKVKETDPTCRQIWLFPATEGAFSGGPSLVLLLYLFREGGPPPEPESGLLSDTQK